MRALFVLLLLAYVCWALWAAHRQFLREGREDDLRAWLCSADQAQTRAWVVEILNTFNDA